MAIVYPTSGNQISVNLTPQNVLTELSFIHNGGSLFFASSGGGVINMSLPTGTTFIVTAKHPIDPALDIGLSMSFGGDRWALTAPVDLSSMYTGATTITFFLNLFQPPGTSLGGTLGQNPGEGVAYALELTLYAPPIINNMATGLYFDHVFAASAGQTLSFEILGELGVSGIAFDESIIIEVPKEEMSKVLGYRTNWLLGAPGATGTTGFVGETYYQPQPAVVLALGSVLGPWLDSLAKGLTGVTLGPEDPAGTTYHSDLNNTVAGDRSSECESLVLNFQNIAGFTYHDGVAATDYLSQIPPEAIASYKLSAIAAESLSTVVGDIAVVPAAGATMAESGVSGAVQSLFEQAVAAGMIQAGETATAELNAEVLTGVDTYGMVLSAGDKKVYGAQFAAEQSLTIYVQYSLTKSRKYDLQTAVLAAVAGTTGATAAAEVVFGGVTFALPTSMVEVSTPVTQTYQINLVAV